MPQHSTWVGMLAISLGAVPGAVSRYYLTELCRRTLGANFPYGTLIINFTGCLLMGFFLNFFQKMQGLPLEIDLMVRTGFLGAYTTFSTYGYDTLFLWRSGRKKTTVLYWLGSAILAVIGIVLGRYLASLMG